MSKTSMHDLHIRHKIEEIPDVSFYGILLALIARADTDNLARLRQVFPEVVREFTVRYHGPAGALNIEEWLGLHGNDETSSGDRNLIEAMLARAQRIADNG